MYYLEICNSFSFSEEEFSALQAMEEVTMRFDIDDSDEDEMKMVENASVYSEDMDAEMNHRQRPAMFIPPPPPTEPPPEDSQPVDLRMLVNSVDIGEISRLVNEDNVLSTHKNPEPNINTIRT